MRKRKSKPTEKIETFVPVEQAGINKPEIPQIFEEEPRKKIILSKMTEEEREKFDARNDWIREQRKKASIERILKKIAQSNKYSPLIGQKINIQGELYEVKAIERKSTDRKQ